uniref:C-type lectin domain-containing protein n=1 Tax=Branchiostoma floridae TaxID=7739 RepID=C3ZGC8_BRAFL|eukprot:XP_002592438.1 hypothetical protein BRAFLDRAFT_67305 [Branchiostoma floridae]
MRSYWIGLDDRDAEGTFLWNDGTPLGEYDEFRSDAPNEARDCVTLWRTRRVARWDIMDCSVLKPYICQLGEWDFDIMVSLPVSLGELGLYSAVPTRISGGAATAASRTVTSCDITSQQNGSKDVLTSQRRPDDVRASFPLFWMLLV